MSPKTIVALEKEQRPLPQPAQQPIAKKEEPKPPKVISVSTAEGNNQSLLAGKVVNQIRASKSMDPATAGKLHDKVMHYMGYRDLIFKGDSYVFDEPTVEELIRSAGVTETEVSFWEHYAQQAGV